MFVDEIKDAVSVQIKAKKTVAGGSVEGFHKEGDYIIYSITFYAATSYSEIKLTFISSTSLLSCCSIRESVMFFPSIKFRIEFFRCAERYLCISEIIFNCLSLSILFNVS